MGLNNFYNSGENILRKFTSPAKLLHPINVVGHCHICTASNLLLNSLMQTLLSFMNTSLPMYCKFVLNNWHFLGDIFRPFFNNAFNKSSNFCYMRAFDAVNNRRSSMITSQYFLLCKQSKIALI